MNPPPPVSPGIGPPQRAYPSAHRRARWTLGWLLATFCVCTTHADLQFDVFLGYGSGGGNDGVVRECSWFPVGVEVFNDGPPFEGTIVLSSRQTGAGQARRLKVELPTNTRKRMVFPVFAGASRYASWDARLLDARGKLRAERPDLRSKDIAWETALLGGLARSHAGMPVLPSIKANRADRQPQVSRLTVEQFPDNPLALEGLTALYLNSEKALELRENQTAALVSWLHGGGHLIIAPEQLQDFSGAKWLRDLLPIRFQDLAPRAVHGRLEEWLGTGTELNSTPAALTRTQPGPPRPGHVPPDSRAPVAQTPDPYATLVPDTEFNASELPVFTGRKLDGDVLVSLDGLPLVIQAHRGRGQITLLAFSPEREPFKSWKLRSWFWARLLQLPGALFNSGGAAVYGGWSLDAVFGAMIDTRQVRKLPVEWLLALLVVYLVVIGPLDHWWLKKINRQMLTWITFPLYVLIFSVLIYYIGYRLRAGETEWNELHVVDLLPRQENPEWRGRTFASLYSSVNARYRLASDQPFASLRGEFLGPSGGGQESSRVEADLVGNAFEAEVSVPVWSSCLYVTDWIQSEAPPVIAALIAEGGQYSLAVENRLPRRLSDVQVAFQNRLHTIGDLAPQERKQVRLQPSGGLPLEVFVRNTARTFQTAAASRRQAFGQQSRLEPSAANAVAASFISQLGTYQGQQRTFVYPGGLELSPLVARGEAVLFAWDAGHSAASSPLLRHQPPRLSRNTLYRLAIPPGPAN